VGAGQRAASARIRYLSGVQSIADGEGGGSGAGGGEPIGFVGLGSMGSRVVARLLDAGYPVVGWNRTPAKAEALAADGMEVAGSPREAAERSRFVFSMVTDTDAVERIADGEQGIIAGLGPGKVWAEMSTIAAQASQEVAARVARTGASMLDTPVSGSVATLEAGELSIMVGGEAEAFERIEPVLRAIGPKVNRVGDNGQALQTKVAINLALVVQVVGFCEGVALAEKAGVPRESAVEAMLNSVVSSPVLNYRGPFILEGRMPEEAWANVDLQQKDLMLALDLGRELGVPLPTTAAANELLNACRGLGIGGHDFVVVYDVYRRLAGIA
jgi:3-hydroxyisobutyrate dehydrogenase-like beta-hydroxyacid dehydrogenase